MAKANAEKKGAVAQRRTQKPQIARTFANGKVRYHGVTLAARWIAEEYGLPCRHNAVINAILRKPRRLPVSISDIVRREWPELFAEEKWPISFKEKNHVEAIQ